MKDRLAHGPEENPRADAAVECDCKPSTVGKVRLCVRSAEAEIAHASEGEANNDEENAEPEKQQERTKVVRKKGEQPLKTAGEALRHRCANNDEAERKGERRQKRTKINLLGGEN